MSTGSCKSSFFYRLQHNISPMVPNTTNRRPTPADFFPDYLQSQFLIHFSRHQIPLLKVCEDSSREGKDISSLI